MGHKKTATAARDTRPDLATGYDEKIREARGILKDLNVQIREARAVLSEMRLAVDSIQDRFTRDYREVAGQVLEDAVAQFTAAGQTITDRTADQMTITFREAQEEVIRIERENIENFFHSLVRAIAFGTYGADIEELSALTPEQLQAWVVKIASTGSNNTTETNATLRRAGRKWVEELARNLPNIREMVAPKIDDESITPVQVYEDEYPIQFDLIDKTTGKVVRSNMITDASQPIVVRYPKDRSLSYRYTNRYGKVVTGP